MSLIAFTKFRFLWGAVDWENGTDHPYDSGATASLGASAAPGAGIGVRRVICTLDRTAAHAGADAAEWHFDFLNMTAGSPDDTWTSGDYTTLEGYLDTFYTAVKPYIPTGHKLTQYAWYREGPGVGAPNPAERLSVKGTPIAGTGTMQPLPPQAAMSVTFRTSVRKSWGRTYLPLPCQALTAAQTFPTANVDTVANAVNALVSSAASSDFYLVVTSRRLSAALNVERIEVDDNVDVIRRRRWKSSTYKKLLP